MDDASFFREQAERCRDQAGVTTDLIVQSVLQALAPDCSYADEIDQLAADRPAVAAYADNDWEDWPARHRGPPRTKVSTTSDAHGTFWNANHDAWNVSPGMGASETAHRSLATNSVEVYGAGQGTT